jgi:hypothetical protein
MRKNNTKIYKSIKLKLRWLSENQIISHLCEKYGRPKPPVFFGGIFFVCHQEFILEK